jgi:thymidylate synthase
MSNSSFYARRETSIERAWARTFLDAADRPGLEMAPFTMCIDPESATGLTLPNTLTHPLVTALDACLEENGQQNVEKVAFPLFPERVWRVSDGDRRELYAEFLRNQPTYVAWEPNKNKCGTYFGRLIGFGVSHKTGKDLGFTASKTLPKEGNQLEHIIRQCKRSVDLGRSVARMQLQATIFDPYRDLTTSGQPCFPCLQHIAFDPDIKAGTLAMSAFYATQKLFVKAFGNWLGLCRLGWFVAEQSGLKLARFTCFAGVQKMDDSPKAGAIRDNLINAAKAVLAQSADAGPLVVAHAG